jgi:ribosomal protein S18 acetylase RimI-like enzyme
VNEIGIRRATALDNELLARLAAETFPGNFVGMDEPAGMKGYIETRFTPEQQATELAESGSTFFIGYLAGEPVGYARVREDETPDVLSSSDAAEIHRLYVVQKHWSSGVGRALVEACIEEVRNRGRKVLWLGAWSENPRAVAFYRSLGFVDVGTKKFRLGEELHDDLIFELRL